jgi:hypothetical protein
MISRESQLKTLISSRSRLERAKWSLRWNRIYPRPTWGMIVDDEQDIRHGLDGCGVDVGCRPDYSCMRLLKHTLRSVPSNCLAMLFRSFALRFFNHENLRLNYSFHTCMLRAIRAEEQLKTT